MFGAGTQSLEHIRAVLTVRNLPKTIFIINRSIERAEKLRLKLMAEIEGEVDIKVIALSDVQTKNIEM